MSTHKPNINHPWRRQIPANPVRLAHTARDFMKIDPKMTFDKAMTYAKHRRKRPATVEQSCAQLSMKDSSYVRSHYDPDEV